MEDFPLLSFTVSSRHCLHLQDTHLLWPIRSNRGFPSPALLFGIRPVWNCGGNSWGGCSALGRSCKKRSIVNCALESNNDELADDCAVALSALLPSATLAFWRELSPASGADGRRVMMRDSITVVVVQGILLERETQKKKLKCEKTQGK